MSTKTENVKKILKKVLGDYSDNGTEKLYFSCPFCVGQHTGTKRRVFYFNIRSFWYGCYRCGEKGRFVDLCKKFNIKINKEIEQEIILPRTKRILIPDSPDILIDDYFSFKDGVLGTQIVKKYSGIETTCRYAKSRGFLDVECGYTNKHPYYVIFPIFNQEGKLVYYQGRHTINNKTPFGEKAKTVNPDIAKPAILYSPYGITDKLILVEGIADAIATKGHGLLGKVATSGQIRMIERLVYNGPVTEIVVWFDGDAIQAILKFVISLYFKMADDVKISFINWLPYKDHKDLDPDNIGAEVRSYLFDNRITVTDYTLVEYRRFLDS